MTIQVTITFANADELMQFASWYDARHDNPIAYSVTEKAQAATFDAPIDEKKPESKAKTKPAPKAKKEPVPAANEISKEDFEKAVKTWFSENAATRGPVVQETLNSFGVAKLGSAPSDKYAAILTALGLS